MKFSRCLVLDRDLNHLREGEWLDLQANVLNYVDWMKSWHKEITRDVLKKIQQDIAEVLTEYTKPEAERDESNRIYKLVTMQAVEG